MATGPVQQQLDGMPARLFSCTPSRLAAFEDCPRRYRFTYLDRPPPPRGPARASTAVGAAVHLALARWWDAAPAGRTPERAAALVDGAWTPVGFRDDEQVQRVRRRTRAAVAAYAARLDPAAEPAGVERTVGTRTAALALSGRVDRLDRRGGRLVVVDYKVGRRTPDDDDARTSLALALYAVAAGRTLRTRCTRVELHHVPTGTTASAEHDDASLGRALGRAESIATDAVRATAALAAGADRDAAFPAAPSRLCAWCDFRDACPAGLAAEPVAAAPWDGVDDGPAPATASPAGPAGPPD